MRKKATVNDTLAPRYHSSCCARGHCSGRRGTRSTPHRLPRTGSPRKQIRQRRGGTRAVLPATTIPRGGTRGTRIPARDDAAYDRTPAAMGHTAYTSLSDPILFTLRGSYAKPRRRENKKACMPPQAAQTPDLRKKGVASNATNSRCPLPPPPRAHFAISWRPASPNRVTRQRSTSRENITRYIIIMLALRPCPAQISIRHTQ